MDINPRTSIDLLPTAGPGLIKDELRNFHPRKGVFRIGLLANEFYDPALGRMGGFGWLARHMSKCFDNDSSVPVDLIYLSAGKNDLASRKKFIHGRRFYERTPWRLLDRLNLQREKIDLFLCIDYRPNFQYFLDFFKDTPILIWVQDPKTEEDWARIRTVRIPGDDASKPGGLGHIDCTSLADVYAERTSRRVPVLFAAPASFLKQKVLGTYAVQPPEIMPLPYMVDADTAPIVKSEKASIVFLGRLDPQKRPWLFTKIAEHFPDVDFKLFGQSHFSGPGSWEPGDLPPNVRLYGHIEGDEKRHHLSSAWLLLNTSIHEGLPISFIEALLLETPIVSCVNPEDVPKRFGAYVGEFNGAGYESVPAFVKAIDHALANPDWRKQCGAEGRAWSEQTHTTTQFIENFWRIIREAGPPS